MPEQPAPGEGLRVALLPQKQSGEMWTVSHSWLPVLCPLGDGATCTGCASYPYRHSVPQPGTPALEGIEATR